MPDILPVAMELISIQVAVFRKAVRDDMLAEIAAGDFRLRNQRLFEHLPAENVDAHGRQVASRLLRLLLKGSNLTVLHPLQQYRNGWPPPTEPAWTQS